jgi:hypothetical protein
MKKVKRYQNGGITITPQENPAPVLPGFDGYGASGNTYPFQSNAPAGASTGSGVNQTFNIQPTAQSTEPQAAAFKKGGAVKMAKGGSISASRRADGCAVKGKTRGMMR